MLLEAASWPLDPSLRDAAQLRKGLKKIEINIEPSR